VAYIFRHFSFLVTVENTFKEHFDRTIFLLFNISEKSKYSQAHFHEIEIDDSYISKNEGVLLFLAF
jgi:hypothetical protein